MPREEFLRREVWSRLLGADRFDVPHLNIFIAACSVLGPDDTACASFARGRQRPFRSDHLVHSEPRDFVMDAKDQFYLCTARRAFD